MKHKAGNNQSLSDIAIMLSGSVDGVTDIIEANGLDYDYINVGTELEIPVFANENVDVKDYFNKENIVINTGIYMPFNDNWNDDKIWNDLENWMEK